MAELQNETEEFIAESGITLFVFTANEQLRQEHVVKPLNNRLGREAIDDVFIDANVGELRPDIGAR